MSFGALGKREAGVGFVGRNQGFCFLCVMLEVPAGHPCGLSSGQLDM